MGEYTLAVRETQVGTPESVADKVNLLNVYPNPTSDTFRITVDTWNNNHLGIYDASGKVLEEFVLGPGQTSITWTPGQLPAGAYFIILKSEWDEILARERVIYSK